MQYIITIFLSNICLQELGLIVTVYTKYVGMTNVWEIF
jgi:hypothetical protein